MTLINAPQPKTRARKPVKARGPGVNLMHGTCADCSQPVSPGHGPVTGTHATGYQIHCKPARPAAATRGN